MNVNFTFVQWARFYTCPPLCSLHQASKRHYLCPRQHSSQAKTLRCEVRPVSVVGLGEDVWLEESSEEQRERSGRLLFAPWLEFPHSCYAGHLILLRS